MVKSGSSICSPGDKGLLHSGIFLRPRDASSLQRIIQTLVIKDHAQFTVAKSQIHSNGQCEILVRILDPRVSTSTVMDHVKKCRDLVKDSGLSDHRKDPGLDRTIELSDDDSICVVSPSPFHQRTVKFKTSSAPQPSVVLKINDLESPLVRIPETAVSESLKMGSDQTALITSSESSREVTLKRSGTNSVDEPVSKRPSLMVEVSTGEKRTVSPVCNKSDALIPVLEVSEDVRPSAPAWTSTDPCNFPLSKVNVMSGAKGPPSEEIEYQPRFSKNGDVENTVISKILGAKGPVIEERIDQSNSPDKDTTPLHTSETPTRLALGDKDTSNVVEYPEKQFTEVLEDVNTNELTGPLPSDMSIEILDETSSCSQSNDVMVPDKDSKERNISGSSSVSKSSVRESDETPIDNITGRSSSESSSSESSDEEIIIMKEVLNSKSNPPSLIIDDSDDDVAVCEVVQKKKGKKQPCSRNRLAETTFVSSTSNGPAADFIPLLPTVKPKTFNSCRNYAKNQKLLKMKMKKSKQEKARLRNLQKQSRGVHVESAVKFKDKKKRHEYNGNLMNPTSGEPKSGLRPVIIDGSNVAVGHGKGKFSMPGLKICIKYFTDRGHKVHAFVPKFRRSHVPPEDRKDMDELEKNGSLSFTPSRTMPDGRKVASYDDRFIVQTAVELGGIIVSTDNYRDLLEENESWRETIEQRLLMFTWVGDMLLFPNDPLGRDGPHLEDFLRFPNSTKQT